MGPRALDPVAYGKLLAAELPQPIQSEREFDSMAARLEALDFAKRKLTPEEKAVRDLVPVLGSRAQMSDLVNGKRGISKTQVNY